MRFFAYLFTDFTAEFLLRFTHSYINEVPVFIGKGFLNNIIRRVVIVPNRQYSLNHGLDKKILVCVLQCVCGCAGVCVVVRNFYFIATSAEETHSSFSGHISE